jgi:energy-coupling factor transporter ATP-binding protein EcfA2
MPEIEVKNLGPIEEFRYEIAEPGLHLLVGPQGSGKSTTLRTVELATQGETSLKPTKRDGSKNGEATVCGKTLKISRTTREEGELTVQGLGDLDLTSLHWPKFATPAIRDKTRIATLCRLSGLKGGVDDFKEIVPEAEWNQLVGPKVAITDDIVELASRVKRAVDAGAAAVEKDAEAQESCVAFQRKLYEGVDLTQPCDEAALSAEYTKAVVDHQRLLGEVKATETAKANLEASQRSLEAMPVVDLVGITAAAEQDIADAETAVDAKSTQLTWAEAEIKSLEQQLAAARGLWANREKDLQDARTTLKTTRESAAQQIESARKAVEQRAHLEEAIASAVPPERSPEEVTQAAIRAEAASAAIDTGRTVRVAVAAKAKASEHEEIAKTLTKKAESLRNCAKKVMSVLGDSIAKIPNCPLEVLVNDDGETRLVIESDRSDHEYFDELSDGERWKVIVPLCLKENRLLTLPQAAFGEMAPSTAAALDEMIRSQGAYVLTAVAADTKLQGMSYREWIKSKT